MRAYKMKRLLLISVLLLSFNSWANEAFDNCIVIAEEAKENSKKCEEISLLNEELK